MYNSANASRSFSALMNQGETEAAPAQAASPARGNAGKKGKRRTEPKFGHEFKAKVRAYPIPSALPHTLTTRSVLQKAGGDVKKGGVDPYAYMSLSQAAKKQNRGGRLGIAGKR